MAVGASDAYFCDAYMDLIVRTLRAKDKEPSIELPDRLGNLKIPVTAFIHRADNWRWRMALRALIEHETVLSLEKIKSLFNQFFNESSKILNESTIEPWVLHRESQQRLWGISKTDYRSCSTQSGKRCMRKAALKHYEKRMDRIFQRRHDCIHNCDRPKSALQAISVNDAKRTVQDIEFLVCRCHEAFKERYPKYLIENAYSAGTRNAVTT